LGGPDGRTALSICLAISAHLLVEAGTASLVQDIAAVKAISVENHGFNVEKWTENLENTQPADLHEDYAAECSKTTCDVTTLTFHSMALHRLAPHSPCNKPNSTNYFHPDHI